MNAPGRDWKNPTAALRDSNQLSLTQLDCASNSRWFASRMTPVCTSVHCSPLQHFARTKTTYGLRNHPMSHFDPNRGKRGPCATAELRTPRRERPLHPRAAPGPRVRCRSRLGPTRADPTPPRLSRRPPRAPTCTNDPPPRRRPALLRGLGPGVDARPQGLLVVACVEINFRAPRHRRVVVSLVDFHAARRRSVRRATCRWR